MLTPHPGPVHATIVVRNARTLVQILLDPVFRLAEAYRTRAILVRGDLVGALEGLFRRQAPPAPAPVPFRQATLARAEAGRQPALRPRQRLLPALARRRDGLHLRVLLVAGAHAWSRRSSPRWSCVCRKLRLRPGETVLEAGCGWGALARYMTTRYGVSVTACNVSQRADPLRAASARRTKASATASSYVQDDFRNVAGRFDVFVSVGMLEHVGLANYRDLGRVIHERLDPRHGRGLLHFIGRNRPRALDRWIAHAHLPGRATARRCRRPARSVLEPWDFSVLDVENLRPHYARTLEHWRRALRARGPARERAVRRALRPQLAAVPGGLAGGVRGGLAAAVPGAVRARPRGRRALDARAYIYRGGRRCRACDALVVGGGPAGSTCASGLRRAGPRRAGDGPRARSRATSRARAGSRRRPSPPLELDLDEYGARRVLQPIRGLPDLRRWAAPAANVGYARGGRATASAAASSTTTCCAARGRASATTAVLSLRRDGEPAGRQRRRRARRSSWAPAGTSARWRARSARERVRQPVVAAQEVEFAA